MSRESHSVMQHHRSNACWFVILIWLPFAYGKGEAACSTYTRCSDCLLENPSCGWCNDPSVFQREVGVAFQLSSLKPISLCRNLTELSSTFSCPAQNILFPKSSNVTTYQPSLPVQPSSVVVILRPGDPIQIPLTVTLPQSFPIDLYILMGLTRTLEPYANGLKATATKLITTMQGLTSSFRIAFGSYVDKRLAPFSDRENLDNPCAVLSEVCESVYDFHHTLNFTNNATLFMETLNASVVSANLDAPDAMLDALLQIALCENQVGWSPAGQSRRIVFVMTTGDYHYALDGTLAGLVNPPSLTCRLSSSGFYQDSETFDYPSAAIISQVLNEKRIIPIFAHTSTFAISYTTLANQIKSAFLGDLLGNANNLPQVLSNTYATLSSTVIPVVTGASNERYLSINVSPQNNCAPGRLQNGTIDTCMNISVNSTVHYVATLMVTKEFCAQPNSTRTMAANIQFIGFGDLQLAISVMCQPCQSCLTTSYVNSSSCSDSGTQECSTCVCSPNKNGPTCNCSTDPQAISLCRPDTTTPMCNGRGSCVCGKCVCDSVGGVQYGGQYCQCDRNKCPMGYNSKGQLAICSGNGNCFCDSCSCNQDYTGYACSCPTSQLKCVEPGAKSVCSNAGQCLCGICICNNVTARIGTYCEACKTCTGACNNILSCVACHITGTCGTQCANITYVQNRTSVPGYDGTMVFRSCSITSQSCEVIYELDRYATGLEANIYVVLDTTQKNYATLHGNGDCNPSQVIWPIPVGIVLGIIVVGIIALILWKACSKLGEFLEYKQWEKSLMEETNRSGSNPLFVDPTSSYSNPRYNPNQN